MGFYQKQICENTVEGRSWWMWLCWQLGWMGWETHALRGHRGFVCFNRRTWVTVLTALQFTSKEASLPRQPSWLFIYLFPVFLFFFSKAKDKGKEKWIKRVRKGTQILFYLILFYRSHHFFVSEGVQGYISRTHYKHHLYISITIYTVNTTDNLCFL